MKERIRKTCQRSIKIRNVREIKKNVLANKFASEHINIFSKK
ncbi:MAG: hypothetical protein BAJALOKI2v1_710023 [Promethearchaeota archaeon]|nr:MAG: hypothetical protein BAJALOKI2v1_710023 [Candidatus Lokiarchaeota archaeon]